MSIGAEGRGSAYYEQWPQPDRHERHHVLIAERFAAFDQLPRRSGLDKIRRREAAKRAWWTLTGHLRSEHAVRGQAPFLHKTWEEVAALHERLHGVES